MLKALIEKRNALANEMNELVKTAATETRALTEDEDAKFKALEAEVRGLDDTIEKAKNETALVAATVDTEERDLATDDVETREIEQFAGYIRAQVKGEIRENNLTMGENGAVVPHTIANMIVKKIVDISPLYERATKFATKGTLSIPYYDEDTNSITVGFLVIVRNRQSAFGSKLGGTLVKRRDINDFLNDHVGNSVRHNCQHDR